MENKVAQEVRQALAGPLQAQGFDLWAVKYQPQGDDMVLQILVDRLEGDITMDDLVMLTEVIGDLVDAIQPDPFPEAYLMDISSPGAQRALENDHDYRWAVGKVVELSLTAEPNATLTGVLEAVAQGHLVVSFPGKGQRVRRDLPLAELDHVQLALNQDRVLKTDEDFAWALHKYVQVSTYQKLDGVKSFAGELVAADQERLVIGTEADDPSMVVTIPRNVVASAKQTNMF